GRLHVSMRDSLGVGGIESIGEFDCQAENFIGFYGLPGDTVFQRRAFEVLHGDECPAIFLADVVDGAGVGMVESGCRLASRWKRARAWGSRLTSSGRNFSATKRWRRVSSAL